MRTSRYRYLGPGSTVPRTEETWLVHRGGVCALAIPPSLAGPLARMVRRELERLRRINAGVPPAADEQTLTLLALDLDQVGRQGWRRRPTA